MNLYLINYTMKIEPKINPFLPKEPPKTTTSRAAYCEGKTRVDAINTLLTNTHNQIISIDDINLIRRG